MDFNEVAVVLVRLWDRCHEGLRSLEGRGIGFVQRLDVDEIFLQTTANQKTNKENEQRKQKKNLIAHATSLVKIGPVYAMVGHLSKSEGLLSAVRSRLVQARILKLLAVQERRDSATKKEKKERNKQGFTLQRGGRCGRAGALRGSSSR